MNSMLSTNCSANLVWLISMKDMLKFHIMVLAIQLFYIHR